MARQFFKKYGARWTTDQSDLEIEMYCIRRGGKWKPYPKDEIECGEGLEHHYEQMRKILWPHLDDHRWHQLCRDSIIQNKICVLMGPASSGKTHEAAWLRLCEYYCFPEETCVLVSSTDIRGLQLRVWGEIKMLHTMAKEKFPDDIPGHLVESRLCISTDDIEEDKIRDLRKGIIGVPCVQGGRYIGLGKYVGIKQKRMRLLADEAQFMGPSFLSAFSNLDKNQDFRATIMGNPKDIMDQLGKAAEPVDGWGHHLEPKKTETWKTRFMDGICVNLVGTDSPNFDYPEDEHPRFPYLISKEKIENTLSFFPKDSAEYYSQCVGVMKIDVLSKRVITRELARLNGALELPVWIRPNLTRIFALDAAYGGDRCVGGHIEFGDDVDKEQILEVHEPEVVPVLVRDDLTPEEQISIWVRDYCEGHDIPPENAFHDSTGRGTLGTILAREWSAQCNPIEFGGRPTPRPVSLDLYIYDPKEKRKRLKRCDEHYDRFVTELWWSIRLAIESRQIRAIPEEVLDELCMREWTKIRENKISIETKKVMKERVGRSPDMADWLAIAVEGARRRGFQIKKAAAEDADAPSYLGGTLDALPSAADLVKAHTLNYSA